MNPTIVIADDHPILLTGTKTFLESKRFKVLATALDGNDAYNAILTHHPDIAVLDFDMPKLNGLEVAAECQKNQLTTKIIILTLFKEEAILKEVGKSIQGYLLKEDALQEIELCINQVLSGTTFVSKQIEAGIHFAQETDELNLLTATEAKILKYLAKNFSSSQIADELFISKRTVEKHRSNIIKKLEIPPTQNGLLLWVQKHPQLFNT
ncbi:MAG TPA: response regulator transcription factor [Flavobacteriaceae bacterium]|nr:response regulator transcription factor [Flavobacteriaceae bacterium]MCB9212742.1 response regulator transcription factor [Alteromonas sp.]HPF11743.1 response regulator transcription factor [Flavobacteriaceae bacterium]HQU20769.1 response regulator transcription factor [Flavobacteriaceae bacterium]HQU64944.1 response regulator transcription factor [Flavobacteriaceae bacterium]